jgi:3-hydroxyisobutyrate dehydrogenase-like beta-hydroxyacid dehydrogenase
MTTPHRTTVTVLGLGAMGSALARALLADGHPTTVWNRSPERAEPLAAAGARPAATAADAIAASPLSIACVLDADALHEVLDEAGDAPGHALVNLTSTTPEQARALAGRVEAYVDGGIMAVPPMIGTAQAFILYSGSEATFEAHRSVLEALGSARYVGADPGMAALYDVALLSGMYGMLTGALHAFALVGTEGVDATAFNELLVPWLNAMAGDLPRLAEQVDSGHSPGDSPLAMQATGVASMVAASRAQGVDPGVLVPVQRLLDEAVAAGHGDRDFSALVEVMR